MVELREELEEAAFRRFAGKVRVLMASNRNDDQSPTGSHGSEYGSPGTMQEDQLVEKELART